VLTSGWIRCKILYNISVREVFMRAFKSVICALLIVYVLFSFSGCFVNDFIDDVFGSMSMGNAPERMNETEIYEYFMDNIPRFKTDFVFENADEELVVQVYDSIIEAHPEFFWLGNGYESLTETKGAVSKVAFSPITLDEMDEVERGYADEFHRIAGDIVKEAKQLSSDYERVLFVHDTIIESTDYDKEAAALIGSSSSDNILHREATAYGCLVEGEAVCSGYSSAFQHIMNKLCIECKRVSGTGMNGESHQWNIVKIDGENYYIDVTWDDPVTDDGRDNLVYDYFLITTEELLLTHEIDADELVPLCTADEYNYFVYNGLYVGEYSFRAVERIIEDHSRERSVSLKFESDDELMKAQNELLGESRIFDIDSVSSGAGSVYYLSGANGLVLTIYW